MCRRVCLRPVTSVDDRFLRALFADSVGHYDLLGADVRELLIEMDYRGLRSRQYAQHPELQRFIVTADGVNVGSLVYDTSSGITEILELTIMHCRRRHGIGTAVLDLVPPGPKALTLRAKDVETRDLFARHGFTVAGQTGTRVMLRSAA